MNKPPKSKRTRCPKHVWTGYTEYGGVGPKRVLVERRCGLCGKVERFYKTVA